MFTKRAASPTCAILAAFQVFSSYAESGIELKYIFSNINNLRIFTMICTFITLFPNVYKYINDCFYLC